MAYKNGDADALAMQAICGILKELYGRPDREYARSGHIVELGWMRPAGTLRVSVRDGMLRCRLMVGEWSVDRVGYEWDLADPNSIRSMLAIAEHLGHL